MAANPFILPHQSEKVFLTDGGVETTHIFLEGFDLPSFDPFDLSKDRKGFRAIYTYFQEYLQFSKNHHTGFILDSPTWKANPYWVKKMGYPDSAIVEINEKAIFLMVELKELFKNENASIFLGGCIGPCGQGYVPYQVMSVDEAENYHYSQIEIFSHTPVDFISALAMNYVEEAWGIVRAVNAVHIPMVVSFTVEKNGRLPSGMKLQEAIGFIDKGVVEPPLYYMVHCAHPLHLIADMEGSFHKPWMKRIKGIRANLPTKHHYDFGENKKFEMEDPNVLVQAYGPLKRQFKHLNIFGSYHGTNEKHLLEIIKAVGKV